MCICMSDYTMPTDRKRIASLEMEMTADGSQTLFRSDINEHYHSVKGALAESRHVYLRTGWECVAGNRQPVTVFEVGFGTGLNAALTAQLALEMKVPTVYYSVELFPLSVAQTEVLGYDELTSDYRSVIYAEWNKMARINPFFCLNKIEGDFKSIELPENIDVVYFDAFAPDKQPEMWTPELFSKLYSVITPGGVLVTYCAKGIVRRMLQKIGFEVERLPGPPCGKREILRAKKLNKIAD